MRASRIVALFLASAIAAFGRSVVEQHGQLRVEGARLVGQNGEPVSLAGPSLYWSQWQGGFWNPRCVNWLVDDWHATVIRAAMGVEHGGYLQHPAAERARVERVVDAAIKAGVYVIIDWHDHHAADHTREAVTFFTAMAKKYGATPNVMYEIFNEPLQVSWSAVVKPYAETVVQAIRAVDPDNLIIVGTPQWCQDVEAAAADPVRGTNLVYALHFYAGTHKQSLRDSAERVLRQGVPLIISEWGSCNADGNGTIDRASTAAWLAFARKWNLSHCVWAVSDKREAASVVVPRASVNGGWKAGELTEAGNLARQIIRGWGESE